MCISFNKNRFREFTTSYIAGLLASLVVVFALGQVQTFSASAFYFYLALLYILGLVVTGTFTKKDKKKKK